VYLKLLVECYCTLPETQPTYSYAEQIWGSQAMLIQEYIHTVALHSTAEHWKYITKSHHRFRIILSRCPKRWSIPIPVCKCGAILSRPRRATGDGMLVYLETRITRRYHFVLVYWNMGPVTVAERSEACTVFARLETGIVGSNLTQGMNVWYVLSVYFVFVLSCV
jgi:hypothetical protein